MLEVQTVAMASSSYSADPPRARLRRHASIDSSLSRYTISSVASSTLAQPSSTVSSSEFDAATEVSTGESLSDERPYTPPDEDYSPDQDTLPFYVLCMFDFDSDDPDLTPFKRNDIIKVIHKEPSGWWAAQVEEHVGWIPSAFVAAIPFDMVETFQNVRHDLRVYEYEAEALYHVPPTSTLLLNGPSPKDQASFERHEDFQTVTTSHLHSPFGFPTDVTPSVSQFELAQDLPSLQSPTPEGLPDPWHAQNYTQNLTVSITPRTPRTPIPPKVPAPEPSKLKTRQESRQLNLRVDTAPLQVNKPTPPTPISNTPSSPPSNPSGFPLATYLPRSRSLGSSSITGVDRRRPDGLLVHGPGSLGHLSTLVETPRLNEGADEIESTSYENPRLRNVAWRPPKVWRITGDDDAQAFHDAQQAQASQPWYLKPKYTGDEIKMEYDGNVRAGTLEALVERLTVEPLKLEQENTFRHTFMMTFGTFSTADRILELLIERYEMNSPEGLAHEQFMEWKEKRLIPTQARVLHVFTLWVEKYGLVEDDPQIIPRLRDFLELVRSPAALAASAKHVLSILEAHRHSDINVSPLSATVPARRNTKKYRNDLLKLDAAELARQLTLYEARLYVKVRPHECLTWAGTQKGEMVQNLRSFVSTSDKVAAWVKSSILSNDALGKRADTIELWIKVADKCLALNNYSTMSAIVAALTSQVIARLQLTWAHVNKASHIDPLVKLSEPTNNFATYRQLFSSTDGPCLPYIGIFLSDMVKVTETAPDCIKVETSEKTPELSLINFVKRRKMAEVAHTILRHQLKVRDQYKLSEVTPVMQYVEAQLRLAASKDEGGFWMRSQEVQQAELAHADIRKGLEAAGF